MPHNQSVREELFHAIRSGPVGLTPGQAAALADAVVETIAQELEDARMLRWIFSIAKISWQNGNQTHAQICFPLQADMFDTLEEQLRRAQGDTPNED